MAPQFRGLHPIKHRTDWGPWSFTKDFCLINSNNGYEINLEQLQTTADILNWVMHISAKSDTAYGEDCLFHLCTAFADILRFCGLDTSKNLDFNGSKVCKKYAKGLKPYRYISLRNRHLVLERDKFRCQDCGISPKEGATLEIDHTIPIAKGGSNDLSNLRTLCSDCNRGKSDRIVDYS
jgi:5-methylcytosine-specific restriction protein A